LEDIAGRLAVLGLALDRTTLGRIERQERAVFDYEILALAKALRVPPISLLDPHNPAFRSSNARRRTGC
jgi:transcriptional regulator with XRE-family HTH domain